MAAKISRLFMKSASTTHNWPHFHVSLQWNAVNGLLNPLRARFLQRWPQPISSLRPSLGSLVAHTDSLHVHQSPPSSPATPPASGSFCGCRPANANQNHLSVASLLQNPEHLSGLVHLTYLPLVLVIQEGPAAACSEYSLVVI